MSGEFVAPSTWEDAVAEKAARPDLIPVAGGTGLMPALADGRGGAAGNGGVALLDLTRIEAAAAWHRDHDLIRIGATVPYVQIIAHLEPLVPGLVAASRTVGSPQIRNRGTLGGNLGTAAPDGDASVPLLAAGATVDIVSVRGTRRVALADYFTGPGQTVLTPDELVHSVLIPVAGGPQEFGKVGRRTTMTRSICAVGVALDQPSGSVGVAVGAAGPVPLRAAAAELFLATELSNRDLWLSRADLDDPLLRHFGELVAAAAAPVSDLRASAGYRRHALAVLGRRLLERAWRRYQYGSQRQEDGCDWSAQ